MKSTLLHLLAFSSIFLCTTFAFLAIDESFTAQKHLNEYYHSKQDAVKMNVLDRGESILEKLTFGYFGNVSEERATREEHLKMGQLHTDRSIRFTWFSIGISLITLVILFFLSTKQSPLSYTTGGIHSLILLAAGIMCPMLEINYIYNEAVPLHVSKSIFDTIYTTYKNGPIFLAIILLLCSLIIPAIKCIDLCLFPFREKKKLVSQFAKLCKVLGKWSMADVFVVAILVAYFVPTGIQPKDGGYAESYLKPGFTFFLFYCLISLLVNQLSHRKTS